ncbi:hypothetical protein [Desulforamulus ruminis]|uniref:Uncharacterized protein n=1 Tax=Desulforamulus ruminis (strain ATCC 23193 / DSM 2154 / NCIMB 8452 / DL) TaxID=696281 RepID=F6DNV3_DESRL|nr:hypothetical protein [Desulforamulus ruminis]AEG59548.1 hypothetical protein Desru_1274 [Desulforamulus ruminis DSM 2154]
MRVDVVRVFITQKNQEPASPIYVNASLDKQSAKINLWRSLNDAPKDANPHIDFELAMGEASARGASQFDQAEWSHFVWVVDSVSELGTTMIGNMLDRYA